MKKIRLKFASVMLAMLLGGYSSASAQNYDLNGDGNVDVADMSALISYMAGKPQGATFAFRKQEDAKELGESAGKAVDLGLPSGRKWADKNLGYSKDSKYGTYFAWGGLTYVVANGVNFVIEKGKQLDETETAFTWKNYEWINPDPDRAPWTWRDVNKYTVEDGAEDAWWYNYGPYGNSEFRGDGKLELESAPKGDKKGDDAASYHWGGKWRMPYIHEFEELLEHTTQVWDTDKEELQKGTDPKKATGVWGCWFIGPKDKIFLPAAGCGEGQYLEYRDGQYIFPRGKYWAKDHGVHFGHQPTSTAGSLSINRKVCCENEADNYIVWPERKYGLSIRPVLGD